MREFLSRLFGFSIRHSLRLLSSMRRSLSAHQQVIGALIPAVLFLGAVMYVAYIQAPVSFPIHGTVTIQKGASVAQIGETLQGAHVIRSSLAFRVLAKISFNEANIQAGEYYFNAPANLLTVLSRISSGTYGLTPVHVTVPEGSTAKEIADIMAAKFPDFDAAAFKKLATDNHAEGYLFPDTYTFLPNVTAETVYKTMRDNFKNKIATLKPDIVAFGKPLSDVVIMASLLEKEARLYKTRQMIAGILWSRIKIGMPLQVDAVFPYILGKNTVTYKDLDVDSPYNTYKNVGLPPGAIANPGLNSLKAAIHPISSPYLYYLIDSQGVIHYSRTFEGHKENIAKYLQ